MHIVSNYLAYLDPATGSLIIQSVIGVVAGVAVFGRNAIRQLTGKARQLFSRTPSKTEAEAE